ncbi:copper resistance protein CopC [Mesorhizobium sp. KR1-2]|uniref:copper resistance CopC/CopD family protein n=1 Tax=Mesorhizobium sp. KR1-2 TaxID=3156609 RepID=UPI0032B41099
MSKILEKIRDIFLQAAKICAVATIVWTWLAAAALAHASLVSTSPADGAVVDAVPSHYSLTFNEPVSPLSLKLVKPDGSSLQLDSFALKDNTLEIVAPTDLGHGTYVLSWRVVSEDGHPVGGSVVFSVGEASAAPPVVREQIDWTARAGLWAGKVALYIGVFIGVGGAFAIGWLLRGSSAGRSIAFAALAIGLAGAVVSLGFQGLDALGAQVRSLADPLIWSTAMRTSFGWTVIVAIAAFASAALGLAGRSPVSRAASLAALILTGAALSLSGHASAAEPQWLMRPAVFLHATAIAFWTGALIPLGLALKRGGPEPVVALRRFSAAIPYAVAVLVTTGLVLATVQLERPGALIETAYGRVFLIKLVLLVGLFVLAAVNRWTLTGPAQAGDGSSTRRLVRSIAAETAIVLLIFTVTAYWRFTPPPRALAVAAAQPASVHIHTLKAMADLTIAPGRAGTPAEASIVLMTGDFGPLDAKEVTLVLSNPAAGIEPVRRPAHKPGDGTWRVDGLVIPVEGTWTSRIDILVNDFEIVRLQGDIQIRP